MPKESFRFPDSQLKTSHSQDGGTSRAVLGEGGIRPAATSLLSLVRKLKVAQAFGCRESPIEDVSFAPFVWGQIFPSCVCYRVLHLHRDAFTLQKSQDRRVDSLELGARPQHEDLWMNEKRASFIGVSW